MITDYTKTPAHEIDDTKHNPNKLEHKTMNKLGTSHHSSSQSPSCSASDSALSWAWSASNSAGLSPSSFAWISAREPPSVSWSVRQSDRSSLVVWTAARLDRSVGSSAMRTSALMACSCTSTRRVRIASPRSDRGALGCESAQAMELAMSSLTSLGARSSASGRCVASTPTSPTAAPACAAARSRSASLPPPAAATALPAAAVPAGRPAEQPEASTAAAASSVDRSTSVMPCRRFSAVISRYAGARSTRARMSCANCGGRSGGGSAARCGSSSCTNGEASCAARSSSSRPVCPAAGAEQTCTSTSSATVRAELSLRTCKEPSAFKSKSGGAPGCTRRASWAVHSCMSASSGGARASRWCKTTPRPRGGTRRA
eukprot:scaffold34505_cov124-Isochrysis_galbana.AAC.4